MKKVYEAPELKLVCYVSDVKIAADFDISMDDLIEKGDSVAEPKLGQTEE